jgi:hypothetical protein
MAELIRQTMKKSIAAGLAAFACASYHLVVIRLTGGSWRTATVVFWVLVFTVLAAFNYVQEKRLDAKSLPVGIGFAAAAVFLLLIVLLI